MTHQDLRPSSSGPFLHGPAGLAPCKTPFEKPVLLGLELWSSGRWVWSRFYWCIKWSRWTKGQIDLPIWTGELIFKSSRKNTIRPLQQHPAPSCLQQHRCQSPGSNQAICQSLQSWDIPRGFPNASLYTSLFSPPQQGLSDHLISLQYRTGLQTVKLDAPQCTHGCKRCMWDPRECASLHPCSRLFPPHSWHNWRRSPAFRQQRCHHNQILSPGFLAPPAPTDDPEMAAGCGTGIPRRSSLPRRSSYMVLGLQVLTHPKSRKSLHSEIEPTSWQLVLQLVLK